MASFNDKHKTECINPDGAGNCIPESDFINLIQEIPNVGESNEYRKGASKSSYKKMPDKKISDKLNPSILDQYKEKLDCKEDSCVVYKLFKNDKEKLDVIYTTYFKPQGPRNSVDLLSNIHIDEVLSRWVPNHPGFRHIKYHMIDFNTMDTELSKYNIVHSSTVDKYMGVVLNTDVSSGRGKHWFCLFCDFTLQHAETITIEYFNSSGNTMYPEIFAYCFVLKKKLQDANKKAEIITVSQVQHQKSKTECGVYCLYYIYSRLQGISHSAFKHTPIRDEKMMEFRKVLFSNEYDRDY